MTESLGLLDAMALRSVKFTGFDFLGQQKRLQTDPQLIPHAMFLTQNLRKLVPNYGPIGETGAR